jgi:SAM-dependent methyltransferase
VATNDGARWNQRFQAEGWSTEPSSFLASLEGLLPASGSALDVAGGPGRNAIWLAERDLEVTLVDISEVALDMAARRAQRLGIEIDLVRLDLEVDAFPGGPWDLIVCFHYLQRSLMPVMCESLLPGGMLVLELATRRNLERHVRPPAQYLLEEGEAPDLVPRLEVLVDEEGWLDEDRHEARVMAKRPIT